MPQCSSIIVWNFMFLVIIARIKICSIVTWLGMGSCKLPTYYSNNRILCFKVDVCLYQVFIWPGMFIPSIYLIRYVFTSYFFHISLYEIANLVRPCHQCDSYFVLLVLLKAPICVKDLKRGIEPSLVNGQWLDTLVYST